MSDRPLKIYTDLDAKADIAVSGNLQVNTTSSFNVTSIVTSSDGMYSVDGALHSIDTALNDNISSIKSSYENMRFKVEDTLDSEGNATVDLTFDAPAGDTYFTAADIANVSVDLLIDTNNDGRYKNDIASVQLYVESGSLKAQISAAGATNKPYRLLATNEAAVLETSGLAGTGGGGGGTTVVGVGADVSASYIVLGNTASLPNERRLVAGDNITIVDGGAGGTLTISSTGGGNNNAAVPFAVSIANGLNYDGTTLSLSSASATTNGAVTTGSQTIAGDKTFTGNVVVEGTLTAQQYNTEFVSASVIYESGSTKFGNDSSDTHQFSGSLTVSGSLNTAGRNTWSAPQAAAITALTQTTGTITVNLSATNNFSFSCAATTTAYTLAAPTNAAAGQSGIIVITQGGTSASTLAYNSFWKFPDGTDNALSTTLSSVNAIAYYCPTGTYAICSFLKNVK